MALVSGFDDHEGIGAAWVFVRRHGVWSEQQKLTAPRTGPDREIGQAGFGLSVALAGNGRIALLSAPADMGYPDSGPGAAWVFTRGHRGWTSTQKLAAPPSGAGAEIGDASFGADVALATDGDAALIGGPSDNGDAGAAWEFIRRDGGWSYANKLSVLRAGSDGEIGEAAFGMSVALSAEGDLALVGGPYDDGNLGAVWEFRSQPAPLGGAAWSEGEKLTAPSTGAAQEEGDALFGEAVALDADGDTAFVGGPNAPAGLIHGTPGRGAAWVFAAP